MQNFSKFNNAAIECSLLESLGDIQLLRGWEELLQANGFTKTIFSD